MTAEDFARGPGDADSQMHRGQRRSARVAVNGWICLDKPVGVTSTQAVAQLRWLYNAKKAGHAGALDPLASGVLPLALGEATKTVAIVQDGVKLYRFTVKWGEETDTDDSEGRVTASSQVRPEPAAIEALLPQFTGVITQVPPVFSAIKIGGVRAYDLAREGESLVMKPREVVVHRLALTSSERDFGEFEAECGKGVYVRAIARDIGRALGCGGHVAALRRMRVGPFRIEDAVAFDELKESPERLGAALRPVSAGLAEWRALPVDRDGAATLRRGQRLLLRGRDAPAEGPAYAACFGAPIAFGEIEAGYFVPTRVFNLPG
ncbi:MAG TPA: tRNA pseudouridine(55) synthase TruB [Roseiarcus sp.]|nr:tRNA pseudouridine(55) synthase TruB [Roseiarcus sp.]